MYEKAQHHNKLQQHGEEPGLHLKVFLTVHTFTEGTANSVKNTLKD